MVQVSSQNAEVYISNKNNITFNKGIFWEDISLYYETDVQHFALVSQNSINLILCLDVCSFKMMSETV